MDAWEREIRELHEFLEGWIRGSVRDNEKTFSRLENALAPTLTVLVPQGETMDRRELVEHLRTAHGVSPTRKIAIETPQLIDKSADRILASYEEVHHDPGGLRRRHSTVLFAKDRHGPNGLRWLHLHETIDD